MDTYEIYFELKYIHMTNIYIHILLYSTIFDFLLSEPIINDYLIQ